MTEESGDRRRFDLVEAVTILSHTPAALDALLRGLPTDWTRAHEGEGTWSPFDVVGHLIHADRTNWLPRARTILEHGDSRVFDEFDRTGQVDVSKGKSLEDLLDEFATVRQTSLHELNALRLGPSDLNRRGRHPGLGTVTLGQLLSSWTVHDLDHVMQISRVLASQYSDEVGPWKKFLRIVREPIA